MPTNRDVVAFLYEMARLTTLAEESPQSFKVRAYENAAHGVEGTPSPVEVMTVAELTAIKGVGRSIAEKIREFVETGSARKLDELRGEYPPPFMELTKIPGLGPKTLKLIRRELGVENLDDLNRAIALEQLRELPGLGKTSEEKVARAIERLGLHGKDRRTPIAEALPMARSLCEQLGAIEGVESVQYCGSLRRFTETVGDIDITVATSDAAAVMGFVERHPSGVEVIGAGETKTSIVTATGIQVDVRAVEPSQFGAAILYFTGSKAHNVALRQRAISDGRLLNEYGLFEGDDLIVSETEEEVYEALGLQFIPPPLRENTGEIEAAARSSLPELITVEAIRGDLHYHTDRSGDGRSSLEQMVGAAVDRGYEYVAITDHGEDLAINGSSAEEMIAHRDAIRELGARNPGISILFGCELNIGPEGALDYDPEFRMGFDWCVASVHSHFDLPQARQTERILTALADPSVSVLGHLTGRYIGRRPGIEIDVDAVLEALSITGVALEVNGALQRLDAASEVVRKAVDAGVKLVISTDSHHTSELVRMEYGVLTAQRGWAPVSSVANALPRKEFLEWAASRRS